MRALFQVNNYRGKRPQKLSNVVFMSPSIIWIRSGFKRLLTSTQHNEVNSKTLLLIKNNEALTFENQPVELPFHSCQLSFHAPPPSAMISQSKSLSRALFSAGMVSSEMPRA